MHKYFKKTSVVPSSTSAYSFLTKKDVDSANNNVETALAEKRATTRRVSLKYNTYTPQQRAEIGKYMPLSMATLEQRSITLDDVMCIIVRNGVACGTHCKAFAKLKFANNIFRPIRKL